MCKYVYICSCSWSVVAVLVYLLHKPNKRNVIILNRKENSAIFSHIVQFHAI